MIKLPKKKYTPKQDVQLGQIAGAVVGSELGGYIAEGTQFALGTLLLRYSRDYEKQADLSMARFRS